MSTPSNPEPDPTQAIPASGPESIEPTDPTEILPAEAAEVAASPAADATEVIDAQGETATLPTVTAADPDIEDLSSGAAQDPFWTAPAAATAAAPAAAVHEAASVPPVPPSPPVVPSASAPRGPGFWRRFGASWRHAWSTTLGKVAIIGASALAVLALGAAIGLAAFAGGRLHEDGRGGWSAACADQQGRSGSQQRQSGQGRHQGQQGQKQGRQDDCTEGQDQMGRGQMGPGQGQGQQGQRQWGENEGPNSDNGMGQGQMGPGQMGQGQNGRGQGQLGQGGSSNQGRGGMNGLLGNVLHGEVVVGGTTPKTVLYQVGEVTEFTAGTSLAVKSADGFTATYAITTDTTGPSAGLATGATVRVLADKDGTKATRIVVVTGSATATN